MELKENATQFAVLGLGRFGASIVQTLAQYDVNILACDHSADRLLLVQDYATHVVQADASDEAALERLGLGNFDVVVLAMAEDFEASVIATMKAKELGAGYVVVKAFGRRQQKILESVGADLVVVPEYEMGVKLARRLVRPNLMDVLEDTQHYEIAEMRPAAAWVGKTVREADVRKKSGINILAVIRGCDTILPVQPEQVILEGDVLVTLAKREA